jgi:D-amino-acid oxidase
VVLAEGGFDVTLFARDVYKTASAVAGAIWYPYHVEPRVKVERWGLTTYHELAALVADRSSGVSMVEFQIVSRHMRRRFPRWSREMKRRYLDPAECDPYPYGFSIEVPLIETPLYLPWLRRRLRRAGGSVVRRTVGGLEELTGDFSAVVNCAGLGARKLCDDKLLRSGRGIVVKTDNPGDLRTMVCPEGKLTYIVPRRSDVVLGGTDDRSEERIIPSGLASAIHARCTEVENRLPAEFEPDVGFRPLRREVRLERERGTRIIHNYGHGGAGFTLSWGCARDVLRLVKGCV